MGIIYNNNVEETKIYQAYGLTVYGKINRYEWTIFDREDENALITIRIADAEGKDIFSMCMVNNCILQSRIDDTLDNFLWWIAEDQPDAYATEKQIYKSLCQANCLFDHSIRQRKDRQRREEAEKKRIAECEKENHAAADSIKAYCDKKGFIPYFTYDKVYIIKAHTEDAFQVFKTADNKRMQSFIELMGKYPNNKDAKIVTSGSMEEILQYIA